MFFQGGVVPFAQEKSSMSIPDADKPRPPPCPHCAGNMRLKMKLPKAVGPGFIVIFECEQCRRFDYVEEPADKG